MDPKTGKLKLSGAAHFLASAGAADSGSECYIRTEKNRKFQGYKPWHATARGKSFIIDWLNQLYSISDARFLQGEHETFQMQYCSVGGGNLRNSWHQYFDGNALWYQGMSDRKIKWTWGTGASSSGTIKTKLNFSVTKGPVSIGASTTVTTGVGSYVGDFGLDGHFAHFPNKWKKYGLNHINTYFISPHNHSWDGTSDFEGNTGQVVYEWSMRYWNTHTLYFNDWIGLGAICGKLFGHCKSFQ